MYRVLDNNRQYIRTHKTKASALQEVKGQQEYSASIGQSTGPLFLQEKRDGVWVTITKIAG